MMSNNVSESEKEIPTGCVSFYTQWFDVCVCIRVRGLHFVLFVLVPFWSQETGTGEPNHFCPKTHPPCDILSQWCEEWGEDREFDHNQLALALLFWCSLFAGVVFDLVKCDTVVDWRVIL